MASNLVNNEVAVTTLWCVAVITLCALPTIISALRRR